MYSDPGAGAANEVDNGDAKPGRDHSATVATARTETQPAKADVAADSSKPAADGKEPSEAKNDGAKEDAKPVEKRKRQYRVDVDLLRAFRYFDKTGVLPDDVSRSTASSAHDASPQSSPSLTECRALYRPQHPLIPHLHVMSASDPRFLQLANRAF